MISFWFNSLLLFQAIVFWVVDNFLMHSIKGGAKTIYINTDTDRNQGPSGVCCFIINLTFLSC